MKKLLLISLITLFLGIGIQQGPPSFTVSYPSGSKVIRIKTKPIKKKEKEVTIEKNFDFSDYFSESYLTIEELIIVIIAIALICSPLFLYKEEPNNTLLEVSNNNLPEFSSDNSLEDSNSNECAICLDEAGELIRPPCSCKTTMFHQECLNRWLEQSPTCPCCRGYIEYVGDNEYSEDTDLEYEQEQEIIRYQRYLENNPDVVQHILQELRSRLARELQNLSYEEA